MTPDATLTTDAAAPAATAAPHTLAARLERGCYYTLLALIVWVPIPLGSNRPWAWSLMEVIVFLILAAWSLSYALDPKPLPVAVRKARPALVALGLFLAYVALQATPIPSAIVDALNPNVSEVRNYALGAPSERATLSIEANATRIELLKYCAYVAIFFLTLVLVNSRRRLERVVKVLFYMGAAHAVYALMAYFSGALWTPSPGQVTGTYVNRNHFAGLMELTIPFGLALLMYQNREPRYYPNLKARLRALTEFTLDARLRTAILVAIMFGALILTTSRGGVISFAVALAAVILFARIVKGPESPAARLLPWVVGLVLVSGAWFGVDGLRDKLETRSVEVDRLPIWTATLEMIGDYPLFGTGVGTYATSIQRYQHAEVGGPVFEHAESDHLEWFSSGGAAGYLLIAAAALLSVARAALALKSRRHSVPTAVSFATLVSVCALLVHGLADFNLQVPANAWLLSCVVAIAFVAAEVVRRALDDRTASTPPRFSTRRQD